MQQDIDTPSVLESLGLTDEPAMIAVYFDARKMMRGYHQTEFAFKWLNNRALSQVPQWMRSVLIYEGKDDFSLTTAHATALFDELRQIMNGGIKIYLPPDFQPLSMDAVEPAAESTPLPAPSGDTYGPAFGQPHPPPSHRDVHPPVLKPPLVLVMADGAGRRSLLGVSSASSGFPITYNDMNKEEVRDTNLFGPITRSLANMEAKQPPEGWVTHDQRKMHAKKHGGIYGANVSGVDPTFFPTDELHQGLLVVPRLLAFTMRAIDADAASDGEAFSEHLKKCCKLRHKIKHVESDGRIVLSMGGNDCRTILDHMDKLLVCNVCDGLFMSAPLQRRAIGSVWNKFIAVLDDLKCSDLDDTFLPGESFAAVDLAIKQAVIVFGPKFITPTLREMRDNNPFFKLILKRHNLTLAHVSVDAFEAFHRIMKELWEGGLKGGGRGHPTDPLKNLLVRVAYINVCVSLPCGEQVQCACLGLEEEAGGCAYRGAGGHRHIYRAVCVG